MIQFVWRLLLIVALVSASGSAPFAHVHPDIHAHGSPEHRHDQVQGDSSHDHERTTHWHLTNQQANDPSNTTTLYAGLDHDVSIATNTLAVKRSSDRGNITPPVNLEVRKFNASASLTSQPLRVASDSRPQPTARFVPDNRAPPA